VAFVSRTLVIDSTGSLTGQVLPLTQPAAGFATNMATVTVGWGRLPMAQQYRLWMSPNPRGTSLAVLDTVVGTASTVTLRMARQNQTYQWKVTALNASSQTVSATQSFDLDLTPPAAPILVTPTASASFLTLPISLNWTRATNDVVQDSVFIYRADQTTLFTNFPRSSSGATLILSSPSVPLITGTYYWAVRSMDKAGNLGPVSAKRAFVLQ
jgi:predicted phage tail protein